MQTVLAYFAARRRQMITVCALSLLLVMHHRVVATRQYNRKNIRCHHRLVGPPSRHYSPAKHYFAHALE